MQMKYRKYRRPFGKTAKEPMPVPKVDRKKLAFLESCARYDCDKEIKNEINFFKELNQ